MDGIINFLKPPGMTSFQAVNFIKKKLGVKKAGHTGTLDPGAAGVLPVCVGKATKIVQFLTSDDKEYRAEIFLGISTTTDDAFGDVLSKKDKNVREEEVIEALACFSGKIQQIPPLYSAIKHRGKRLYELARMGEEISVQPREVEIKSIEIINYDYPRLIIDVKCSKGTYIRSLARDIGSKLDIPAHLSFLVRRKSGDFKLSGAIILEELVSAIERREKNFLISISSALKRYPRITVSGREIKLAQNGAPLRNFASHNKKISPGQLVRVFSEDGQFISIGRAKNSGIIYAVKVLT